MPNSKERKTDFTTISGAPIDRIYGSEKAGEFPYTRGIHETMYRGRLWTMRQYAGFGNAEETNSRYKFLLSQGTTGLSVAFDLPTQMGRDSDHALAKGEVGRTGVAISTVDDMERLLDGIPLDQVSISMTINATASILLSMLLVVAEKRGIPWSQLRGTIQNDVLKEYIARGTYIYPAQAALKITTDIISFCSKEVTQWNTVSISGYHIREAGSTAAQEIAFTLANGIAYVESALKAGLDVDAFAPRLAFFFNCHMDFLEEISKFRAARRLWAKIMKERFKAKKAESMQLRFHTQTAGSSLTAQQPYNNIVRTTIEALAAALGGTQSLHTNAFDEALGLPTETSATVALRTQQIIAHESGVADAVDPLGGSWLIENWTDRLEVEAKKLIEKIDSLGGMVSAIENGFPQREIEEASYRFQQQIEKEERIIVGVNAFKSEEKEDVQIQAIKGEELQKARVGSYKKDRDSKKVTEALAGLEAGAKSEQNVVPGILSALRQGATLGEISDIFRLIYGEYHR